MFAVFFFALLLHTTLSVGFAFNIPGLSFESIPLMNYYRSYAAIGPFFTEKSVSTSYLMAISIKGDNWSEWAYPQIDSHTDYLKHQSYQKLKQAEFEKLMSWYVLSNRDSTFNNYILQYFKNRYPEISTGDSLKVMVQEQSGQNSTLSKNILDTRYFLVP